MTKVPGVIVPIITPFDQKGKIYESGLENLFAFLHEKGIKGVWILGSYGSFPLLDREERKYMAEISLALAKKYNMYSIVQVGSPDLETAVNLAKHAKQAGADALASVLPFYYSSSSYSEENFMFYFKSLLEAAGPGFPLFYYNNPKTTGFTPTVGFVRNLLQAGVSGMKDTTTDFLAISQNIQAFRDVRPDGIYMGGSASVFLPARAMGSQSVVCGTAVSMPDLVLQLDRAVENQEWFKSQELQHLIIRARSIQARYAGRPMASYGILSARGIDAGQCRSPWIAMTSEQKNEVVSELRSIGAIPEFEA